MTADASAPTPAGRGVVTHLAEADVPALALGCALLGSGGGGDVRAAALLLARTLASQGPVALHPLQEAHDDRALAALVGAVGSPTVMVERLPGDVEFVLAVRTLEAHLAQPITNVAPLEIGGVNGLLGVHAAARLGVRLLDADAMGRAFPRLDHLVTLGSSTLCPVALAEPSGGVMILDHMSDTAVERAVRGALPALGTWAAICLQASPVETFTSTAINGSISRAMTLGRALMARQTGRLDDHGLQATTGLRTLLQGTVVEVRRLSSALPGGTVAIAPNPDDGRTLRVDFANEYVLALLDGEPLAQAPDVIQLLDARSLLPVSVDRVHTGQRIRAVTLPSPPELAALAARLGLAAYDLAPIDLFDSTTTQVGAANP